MRELHFRSSSSSHFVVLKLSHFHLQCEHLREVIIIPSLAFTSAERMRCGRARSRAEQSKSRAEQRSELLAACRPTPRNTLHRPKPRSQLRDFHPVGRLHAVLCAVCCRVSGLGPGASRLGPLTLHASAVSGCIPGWSLQH